MKSLCLLLARLSLIAWVGGAVLFVVTSVAEQTSPATDSVIRNHLALIRFPWYYRFGFGLLGASLVTGIAAAFHPAVGRKRGTAFVLLTAVALGLMVADYFWVFQPMVDLITPPEAARSAEFVRYHHYSTRINSAGLLLSLAAAVLIAWPGRLRPEG